MENEWWLQEQCKWYGDVLCSVPDVDLEAIYGWCDIQTYRGLTFNQMVAAEKGCKGASL
jgi:hypothetical protein